VIFSPHILQKKAGAGELVNGNPVPGSNEWETVGECRCDDNGQQIKVSVNGMLYDYSYHVVYEGEKLPVGADVRVLNEDGGTRGEGSVVKSGECNYLDYSEIWM
jgi:hypothetical protein